MLKALLLFRWRIAAEPVLPQALPGCGAEPHKRVEGAQPPLFSPSPRGGDRGRGFSPNMEMYSKSICIDKLLTF